MNLCGACGLDFGSLAAFAKHRIGKHEYTYSEGVRMEPMREDGRRCLDVEELEASGFALNSRGTWSLQASLDSARAAFSSELCSEQPHSDGA